MVREPRFRLLIPLRLISSSNSALRWMVLLLVGWMDGWMNERGFWNSDKLSALLSLLDLRRILHIFLALTFRLQMYTSEGSCCFHRRSLEGGSVV